VSGGTAVAAGLALLAGVAGSVQIGAMGAFGERIGVLAALAFSLLLSTLIATLALVATTRSVAGFSDAVHAPAWLWIGGLMGVFIVFTITFSTPRIGATATIGILIAGQLAMGVVIDKWGLFGLEQLDISWPRLLGVLLLAAGAALSLHTA